MAVNRGIQFELAADALLGNSNARLQQIDVLGTSTVVLGARSCHNELKLNVTGAQTVIVRTEAFNGATFRAEFRAIAELRMHEGAFVGAAVASHLVVVDSGVEDVWPLQTSLREVRFERVRIGRIRYRAFDVAGLAAVEFRSSEIGVVEREAFTEKVSERFCACEFKC